MTRIGLLAGILLVIISCGHRNSQAPAPLLPLPSEAQMMWHEMELNAFIHFTTNTFTNREWGLGSESPAVFNPSDLDADQWMAVLKDAGFKGVILTCKHHDGFCLWPSKYTEHSVRNSPYKNGQGDVVREVADACRRYGLQFGVYLSPWDRNHAEYGRDAYIQYYRNQLTELFTGYGPIFEMWFDGANGGDGYYGGNNETRRIDGSKYYEWPRTLDLVRSMQPDVIFFSDAGPGVRWCGNERGVGGETNWCLLTPDTLYAGKGGIERLLSEGSEAGTHWIPAEVNTSIRPGWFYHEEEDSLVKSPQTLFDIYLTSVGRGSTLLLNVPPDKRGKIHETDVKALKGWRAILNREFALDIAANATVTVSSFRGNDPSFGAQMLTDSKKETYWTTDDDQKSGEVELDFGSEKEVKYVLLQEYIRLGQRVRKFSISAWKENDWKQVAEGTTVGYKRIVRFDPVKTAKVKIRISDSKACPVISNIEVY